MTEGSSTKLGSLSEESTRTTCNAKKNTLVERVDDKSLSVPVPVPSQTNLI
eukprot:CAMPEP_0204643444 /NCGR_PEP_ID=MMETSP0718-20130828/709_1 /ASSEMBLY_ACC=CAM_ASM_000674 /TAXON_ID=230516 /ORGANISM="Chaetoceros curvisetus" /LENGTH=50 /DNA_ID=CAMNT_0051664651 /DNA_START=686 /DNA_END=838 /DNA_ORIENTATION=+